MSGDDRLLPCPFCEHEAAVFHHTPRGIDPSHHVECSDCGCGTCHHETKAEAIAAWNARPQSAPVADKPRPVEEVWEEMIREAVEALREMQEQLVKAQSPQWFYHPDYTEFCQFGPWDVIEHYDLEPGKHVVEIQTARPLPSIWSVVHVLTDAEKDEMETDEAWVVQDFATEAEARATLAAIEGGSL
jgi:Lar family restriction alleviation protein